MRILFLSNNSNTRSLVNWLKNTAEEEVIIRNDKISKKDITEINPDFLISYNYKFIIKKEVLELLPNRAINLHISLLPYNKGSNPNIWSFLEDTPKGVTIHLVDEGLDTGNILVQKELLIDENKETLRSSYELLHREIQTLFIENWENIKNGEIVSKPQTQGGSIHSKKDFDELQPLIKEKGWDTPVGEFKAKYILYKLESTAQF